MHFCNPEIQGFQKIIDRICPKFGTEIVPSSRTNMLYKAELVSDSSEQWFLFKIKNIWVELLWTHINQHH